MFVQYTLVGVYFNTNFTIMRIFAWMHEKMVIQATFLEKYFIHLCVAGKIHSSYFHWKILCYKLLKHESFHFDVFRNGYSNNASLNYFYESSQSWAFSLVCVLKCLFKVIFFANPFLQTSQTWVFSLWCVQKRLFKQRFSELFLSIFTIISFITGMHLKMLI